MKKAPTTNNCLYCKAPLLKKAWAKFCRQQCRKAFNNRRMSRGALIYDLSMHWRKSREKIAFSDLCHQIGIFIQADNETKIKSYNTYPQGIPWNIPKAVLMAADIVTIEPKLIINPPIKSSMADYKYAGGAQKRFFEKDDLEADRIQYALRKNYENQS